MATYSVRKHSLREIRRFDAFDQYGVQHSLVERMKIINDVGASGLIIDSEHGALHYYSATTGDIVVRLPDGSLKTKDGKFVFTVELEDKI